MSMKTMPKGLLAALAVSGITLMQVPALMGGSTASAAPAASVSVAPSAATRCQTVSITGTNFAHTAPVTGTLVFSSTSGTTQTATIATGSTDSSGAFTTTGAIPSVTAYSTTAVLSATDGTSTSTTNLAVGAAPTLTIVPSALSTAGTTSTLTLSGSGFQPGSPVTFTVALSGTAGSVVAATSPVTADASGSFAAATLSYKPASSGTYVVTAADNGACNTASGTFLVGLPGAPVATTYFPEGFTGTSAANGKATFTTVYSLLNPNVSDVAVTTTYLIETINEDITTTTSAPDVVVVRHFLPALSDQTINAATDIASTPVSSGPDAGKLIAGTDQKFATIVQTAGFQGLAPVRGVAAERLIERTGVGGGHVDGDVSLGSTSANTSYYFAEGYTGYQFQEYLLLFNPSPTMTATVSVLRVPEGGSTSLAPLVDSLVLAPYQRVTLNIRRLNALAPEQAIGLIVNSQDPNPNDPNSVGPMPVVAERTEYFGPGNGSAKSGETIAAGLTTAVKQLNFAYGSVTGNTADVLSTITPTLETAQTADNRPFVEVINPNIAGQLIAGTYSGSAVAPGPAAHVTIQLRGEDGRLLGFFTTDVEAGARYTLTDNDLTTGSGGIGFPGVPRSAPTRAGVFSTVVSSSERVVSELSQYFGDANGGVPGLDLVGAPSGETDVLFPSVSSSSPASGQPLGNAIFLYNPGANKIKITGTFYGAAGVVAQQSYSIGPDKIAVIGPTTATVGGVASATALPIPAGTMGAEFTAVQSQSAQPGLAPDTFVAAAVTYSSDVKNLWGTQGLYPLPYAPNCSLASGCP